LFVGTARRRRLLQSEVVGVELLSLILLHHLEHICLGTLVVPVVVVRRL